MKATFLISLIYALPFFASETPRPLLILLPSADILQKKLSNEWLDIFAQATKIAFHLADKTMCPEAIATAVGTFAHEYDIEPTKRAKLYAHVTYAILQDHPEAIEHLKEVGYYHNELQ